MKNKSNSKSASTVTKSKQTNQSAKHSRTRQFSPAAIKLAKKCLEEFEAQADEDFLVRADLERRLGSL